MHKPPLQSNFIYIGQRYSYFINGRLHCYYSFLYKKKAACFITKRVEELKH
jgi:hypothetical protein